MVIVGLCGGLAIIGKLRRREMKENNNKEDLFWSKVDTSGECWTWQGRYKNRSCYFRYNKKSSLANRFAYELTYGAIPIGQLVIRNCGNDRCVRPSHLVLGTYKDLAAIMDKNGHMYRGLEKSQVLPFGFDHPKVTLTIEDVQTIRQEWKNGKKSGRALAREYNISPGYVSKIVHNHVFRDTN